MPNLLTITSQKIHESIHGPRTKDKEFDKKYEEVVAIEKGIVNVRTAFANFVAQTAGLKTFFKAFSSSITEAYDSKSDYSTLAIDLKDTHEQMAKIYDEVVVKMKDLNTQSQNWTLEFEKVKAKHEAREERRLEYDHYDEKLEKLYKERDERTRNNKTESGKDFEKLNRNEVKLQKAAEEFVKVSQETYEMASHCLDSRFEMMNPIITKFIELENKLFYNLAKCGRAFEGMTDRFKKVQARTFKKDDFYDPCKYIRPSVAKEISKTLVNNKKKEKAEKRARETSREKEKSKDDSLFHESSITKQIEDDDKKDSAISKKHNTSKIENYPDNRNKSNVNIDNRDKRGQTTNITRPPVQGQKGGFGGGFDFDFDNDMNMDVSQINNRNPNTSTYISGGNNNMSQIQNRNGNNGNFQRGMTSFNNYNNPIDESYYGGGSNNNGRGGMNTSNINMGVNNNMRNSSANQPFQNNNSRSNTVNNNNNNFDFSQFGNIIDFTGIGGGNSNNNNRNSNNNQQDSFANNLKNNMIQGAMQGAMNGVMNNLFGNNSGSNQNNNNMDFNVKKQTGKGFDPFKGQYY